MLSVLLMPGPRQKPVWWVGEALSWAELVIDLAIARRSLGEACLLQPSPMSRPARTLKPWTAIGWSAEGQVHRSSNPGDVVFWVGAPGQTQARTGRPPPVDTTGCISARLADGGNRIWEGNPQGGQLAGIAAVGYL